MTLRLRDRWVWDTWFAADGGLIHAYYQTAPRSLGDPRIRTDHCFVGHAVSRDLRTWTELEDAIVPAPPGAWDDLAIWSGNVIRGRDRWLQFYTGRGHGDGGWAQRVGLAESTDLRRWHRVGSGPIFEADPRWYEHAGSAEWHEVAWRDPFVFADPGGDGYHAFITARSRIGDPSGRGVIAHATSPDLDEWTVRPPIASPAGFGHLEVLQVAEIEGRTFLVWCVGEDHVSAARRAAAGGRSMTGTYIVRAPGPMGPFHVPESTRLLPYSSLYAGKLVEWDGRWWFLGFVDQLDGEFVGELSDPIPFDPAGDFAEAGSEDG